jgi:hypothetical protein
MLYCLQSLHSTQIDTIELCPPDCSTAEVGTAEVGFAEVGFAEVSTGEVSIVEVSIVEVSNVEVGTAEVGIAEVSTAEIGIAEGGIDEGGITEVGSVEVGKAEVGTSEIRLYLWMLLSPYIPNFPSLSEHVKLVLVCHVVHLLCSALIIERCGYVFKHFFSCFSIGDESPLVLVAKCFCSLRHDSGKPCHLPAMSYFATIWMESRVRENANL